ncbi:MAG: hypothetical protein EXQ70_11500 [Solirubrobacterales bacterium]|nr:hypothetical protein [Solirubrobacterales bacterium]
MAKFDELSEHTLNGLSDEKLINYIQAARDAGAVPAVMKAVGILAFRYEEITRGRVTMKVPRDDIEDVTGTILASAISSAFEGSSVGEFRAWLRTITQRRIADYHEERERHPPGEGLVEERGSDDDDTGGRTLPDPKGGPDGPVEIKMIFQSVLETRSEVHRRVILLTIEGHTAKEVAPLVKQEFPKAKKMTEANAHQIFSRFRKDMRDELR